MTPSVTVLQEHTLGSSALSPKTWPFDLAWLPSSACLVGGSVRDALLERHSDYLDLDFVLPEGAVETARAIARHYKAGFVLLDTERQIARVVFKQGTADFAQQVGDTLEEDLRRRDFTINAIAYNPHTLELLDPLQGCQDLERGLLRMIAPENLAEDPLRLLRAYRQAAQLGFQVDGETQQVIRQLAPNLARIAAERVQSELNYLLSSRRGTPRLHGAWEDGLLQAWFPDATAMGLTQVAAIDQTLRRLKEEWPGFYGILQQRIRTSASGKAAEKEPEASGSTRTWVTTAKLASLLPSDLTAAEAQLWKLKYSRAEIQAVMTVLKYLPELQADPNLEQWSLAQQYFFFQGVGAVFPAIALMAIAIGIPLNGMAAMIDRFLDANDPVAHPQPLLTGQDLMMALKIPPSPRIGKLLAALQLARAEGKIATREEGIKLAEQLLGDRDLADWW
ncbi:CCA tRNA nucleotidyltransferase [Alkalinema sp. FACHB-956]|uniref:CCA tRNA nucleotidyltransferase n=1 Tax=Alkalinema sp. FACHB-956 TaxID=2692768 RepID=UPI00321FE3C5